ncbi:MAG: class I SAM-dependent methyltransferase [Candidatus Zixiibacteriota bacterium]|nr:MAG: class I SAM-dependent methyltransferase [candidate division Zixibacteria bacterium]
MSRTKLYNELAWTWEVLVSEEEYPAETNFVKKMIEKHKRTSGNGILDVGCGAGHHGLFLKGEYEVVGVDGSEKMLKLARKRNPDLAYHLGDVRTFQLNRKFDVVMAMDMIQYNLTYSDLEKALRNLSNHLRAGGLLLFYLENIKDRFEQNKTRFKKHRKDNVEIVLIENDYDPNPEDTEFECHLVFLIRKDGGFQVEVDKHRMGLFELRKILDILRNLNFKTHLYELDFSGKKYMKEGPFFVCEKLD